MRVMAQRHSELIAAKVILYLLSDSSPQGGRLYQLSEYFCFGNGSDGIAIAGEATCRLRAFSKHPEEITQSDLEEMNHLMAIIRDAKSQHSFAPMCMDARNSGTEARAHCLIQQVRVESFTWELTAALFDLFFTCTSDRGPESGLNQTYLPNLDSFPHWRPLKLEQDNELDFDQDDAHTADPIISLAGVIDIAGVFHVVDLIEKRLLGQLKSYVTWQKHFESAVLCFHRVYLRKRFRNDCLASESEETKSMFISAVPNLDGGRTWTVVSQLTEYFGQREEHICRNWDAVKIKGGNVERDDGDPDEHQFKDSGVHIARAAEAFAAPAFWAMIGLVRVFASWVTSLMYWCQGCNCHPRRFRDFFRLRLDKLACPLRTCRAPESAAGKLAAVNDRFGDKAKEEILAIQRRANLTPDERADVMDQFCVGREFIDTEFVIRVTRGWSTIPLRAMVLGHENMEVVITGLIDSLMQFEAIPPENYHSIQPFTLQMFARGGPLREQVLCIVQRSRTWEQVPGVQRIRYAPQHIPLLEQSMERNHARIHSGGRAAPHRSAAYDSLRGVRKNEVVQIFDDTPESVAALAKTFDQCARTPRMCLASLDLQAHPRVAGYMKESGDGLRSSVPHHVAADIIYRVDHLSQTQKFPPFQRPPPPGGGGRGATRVRWR